MIFSFFKKGKPFLNRELLNNLYSIKMWMNEIRKMDVRLVIFLEIMYIGKKLIIVEIRWIEILIIIEKARAGIDLKILYANNSKINIVPHIYDKDKTKVLKLKRYIFKT
jgi:hypothetical protein